MHRSSSEPTRPVGEELQRLRTYAASAILLAHKELIHPSALAAIFQAVVEAEHDVADNFLIETDHPEAPECRIAKQVRGRLSSAAIGKLARPGIVSLHFAHERNQQIEVLSRSIAKYYFLHVHSRALDLYNMGCAPPLDSDSISGCCLDGKLCRRQ